MSASSDRIFPVLNRRTPILDRIRDGREEDDESVATRLGTITGKLVLEGDDQVIQESHKDFKLKFQSALADELGVEMGDIEERFVSKVAESVTNADLSDIIDESSVTESDGGSEESEEGADKPDGEDEEENKIF